MPTFTRGFTPDFTLNCTPNFTPILNLPCEVNIAWKGDVRCTSIMLFRSCQFESCSGTLETMALQGRLRQMLLSSRRSHLHLKSKFGRNEAGDLITKRGWFGENSRGLPPWFDRPFKLWTKNGYVNKSKSSIQIRWCNNHQNWRYANVFWTYFRHLLFVLKLVVKLNSSGRPQNFHPMISYFEKKTTTSELNHLPHIDIIHNPSRWHN